MEQRRANNSVGLVGDRDRQLPQGSCVLRRSSGVSRLRLNRLWPCLAVCLVLVTPAHGVVARQETVTASEDGTSPLVTPIIPDGTDQTYVLFVATRRNDKEDVRLVGAASWTPPDFVTDRNLEAVAFPRAR